MILLGLFLALASIPGYTSVAIPAGWAALSVALPIAAWKPGVLSWAHAAMGLFLLYVFASLAWSVEPLDGVYRLWQFSLIAGAFWLGTVREPRQILIGLAVGYMISSVLAFGQWFGIDFVIRYNELHFPGLHFSSVFAGAIGALLVVALASERLWFLAAACLPGIAIAGSRGAMLAVGVGLVGIFFRRWWLIPLLCASVLAYGLLNHVGSDIERRTIWHASTVYLTLFGQGAGSYVDLFYISPVYFGISRAEHAHNDLLQLLFEFGIGAIPFLAIWLRLCFDTQAKHWPVIAAFTVLSIVFFPLYTPLTATVFALCAGATVRDWSSVSDLLNHIGRVRLLRQSDKAVSLPLPT